MRRRSRRARCGNREFDLVVEPSEVVQVPIGEAADEIAGAVQPLIGRVGACGELSRGQLWPVEIAASQPLACEVKLPWYASGHGLLALIEHERLHSVRP